MWGSGSESRAGGPSGASVAGAGFTEQAYLRVTTEHLEVTVGRDFLWWGPGRFGQLLLSSLSSPFSIPFSPPSRPLDQVRLRGTVGPVTGIAFAAQLDPIAGARRYLSGHRLVWRIHDRLTIGGSEVVLYGGPDRHFPHEVFDETPQSGSTI